MEINKMYSASDRKQQQTLAVRVSMAGSIALFLISAGVGIAVDSVTLILDAAASLIILTSAFLMNFAINKIHKPADDMYNFGYGKYEPLIVSVQGILIFATCVFAIKFAIQDIVHAEDIANHFLPVVATFAASVLGVFISLYLRRLSRRTGSAMLHAATLHWYMDTALSFGVCFGFICGLLLHRMGFLKMTPYVDPVMAIILALILIGIPVKTVMRNILELLDAAPGDNSYNRIKKVVDTRKPKSLGVHRMRTRKAGEKIFIDVIFTANDNLNLVQAEELANRLEGDIKSDLGNCDIVIRFKPSKLACSAGIPA
ncbi:MAG: cation diffusion facilitator family transporter [Candidatus Omnitrophica bacterium]|nr:cation diffusion facilitator family transporter [Candidatus Omnitrophota bacterium]MBU0895559.1 cation diffusion facilitator family transporter [Candidatus Omnitrophota bacterium]MBU1808759.1 cation diffusion facilitator family transporter [Candidatus Omnitrophota bacterium]